jgi:MoaA/NifB/PqqE/SkfB family radical SAM enzyme
MKFREDILKELVGRSVFIWGARMTGLGAHRYLTSRGIAPIGFIDGDPGFLGLRVLNKRVFSPTDLPKLRKNYQDLTILLAVALKEDEITKQIKNYGLEDVPVVSFQSPDQPYYTIDILGSCNLKCASCPHSNTNNSVPKGSMSLETFRKVFDKALTESGDLTHISLYSWGEPLIHPEIDQIVRYAHQSNVAVALSSNLSLTIEDRLDKLIATGPDYLKVSVSGYYPSAYNRTHAGGDINLVKSNLYKLRYLIDKYKVGTLVDINYHLYNDNNKKNLEKFESLAEELGFLISKTFALIMPLERVIAHCEGKSDESTLTLNKSLLVTLEEGINASSKNRLPQNYCPFRENQVNINADLTVPVCCVVYERDGNMVSNNYLQTGIDEINSRKRDIRTCEKCSKLGLPEYNMGFNASQWSEIASLKQSYDNGKNPGD